MTGRARTLVAVGLAGLSSIAGACGEDPPPPEMSLTAIASWNRGAASVDQIGYQLELQIYVAGRHAGCFPLSPDLHVTVNDREATLLVGGECDSYLTAIAHAVAPAADTAVTLRDGDKLLGEATFQGLFPGFGGTHLVSPADGRVRVGEPLAVAVPARWPLEPTNNRASVYFHWLDTPASVPPFYTFAIANASQDLTSFVVAAPTLTGRAMVVVTNYDSYDVVDAGACTGFATCRAAPNTNTFGPVPVEMIP